MKTQFYSPFPAKSESRNGDCSARGFRQCIIYAAAGIFANGFFDEKIVLLKKKNISGRLFSGLRKIFFLRKIFLKKLSFFSRVYKYFCSYAQLQ
jgi:hypothetical protein